MAYRQEYSYSILSNISMIGLDMIRPLNETGYSSSNWALTENQKSITSRSSGDYQRAMKKTPALEQNGIRTHISFTANRSNMADLFQVSRVCCMQRITRL